MNEWYFYVDCVIVGGFGGFEEFAFGFGHREGWCEIRG